MVVAVTYDKGNVFQHFGHSKEFKLYQTEDGKVVSSQVKSAEGEGHGALADLLKSWQVDTLICGGIGGGAQAALAERGIQLFGGVTGEADQQVEALLAGSLKFNPDVRCGHHDHKHKHEHKHEHKHGHEEGGCHGHGHKHDHGHGK